VRNVEGLAQRSNRDRRLRPQRRVLAVADGQLVRQAGNVPHMDLRTRSAPCFRDLGGAIVLAMPHRESQGRGPEPLIINLAPTGMVPTKDHTPHVPITTEEILEDVAACRALGASIIHVHARDESGLPTHQPEYFAPIVEGIREIDPELIVCVTCSGRYVSALEQRAEVLYMDGNAKAEMASLTLGSNNFARQASVNPPEVIRGLAEAMRERGIRPELEVFEPGMVSFARRLLDQGLIDEPCYFNILLGNPGTSPLDLQVLSAFLGLLPENSIWGLAGIGRYQLDANFAGVTLGGHVRVGLEDNIRLDRAGAELATNPALVRRVVELAELAERPVATPAWTRARLGLAKRAGATERAEFART
jgi:3-keto-5-aminohexanoate cleavage enzyme